MGVLRKMLIGLVVVIGAGVILLYITGNQHVLYGLSGTYLAGKSKPDIDDLPLFEVSFIHTGPAAPWPKHPTYNQFTIDAGVQRTMDSLETCALVVIHRDSIIHEQYWMGYTDTTLSNSFSMAKSFMSMLVGVALEEGYLKSLDQPVGDFIDSFREGKNAGLTVRHLLQMSSGIPFGESYSSPFGYMARAYYGKNLEKETLKFSVEREPGSLWAYEGGNSVLLGMVITRATGRSVSNYFEEKIWSRIGSSQDAHWNLDHAGGIEKTFSGFYATAPDFARIGKLYLDGGTWGNDTLVPPSFVSDCIAPNFIPDETGTPCTWYGLHWWLGEYTGKSFFSCRGMRGQYIICVPEDDLIVVRLGHSQSAERKDHMPPDMFLYLDAAYSAINHATP